MEQSPRLALSYVMPNQAQKHVTVNETFRRLDALVQLSVSTRSETGEPASPGEGDAYILPAGASGGAWSGFDEHDLVVFQDGAWARIAPFEGLRAWVADDDEFVVFDGAVWGALSGSGSETAAKFGVNTPADTTNRLAVKSDAVLFSHDDVTPGSGDCRVLVNKDAAGDTASLIFETADSGRAEFGLAGDDDFHVKVSADGSAWTEAIVIDKDDGAISVKTATEMLGAVTVKQQLSVQYGAGAGAAVFGADVNATTLTTATRKLGRVTAPPYTSGQPNSFLFGADNNGTNNIVTFGGFAGASNQASTLIVFHTASALNTTGGTERLRITGAGNVGVNEASPGALFHVDGGGALFGNPTGGDKGTGTVNAQAVYDDNTLLSCYVFDMALDGAVDEEKWDAKVPDRHIPAEIETRAGDADAAPQEVVKTPARTEKRTHEPMRRFAARAGTQYDPLSLDGYARHWRERRHLTAMPNEAEFDPVNGQLTAGEWIQRLVETAEIQAVLIEKLNERVKALEP